MRQEAAGGRAPAEALSARQWDADKYLQPVLPDDGMLQHDFEDVTGPRCFCSDMLHMLALGGSKQNACAASHFFNIQVAYLAFMKASSTPVLWSVNPSLRVQHFRGLHRAAAAA